MICRVAAAIFVWPAWQIKPTTRLRSVDIIWGRVLFNLEGSFTEYDVADPVLNGLLPADVDGQMVWGGFPEVQPRRRPERRRHRADGLPVRGILLGPSSVHQHSDQSQLAKRSGADPVAVTQLDTSQSSWKLIVRHDSHPRRSNRT